MTNEFARALDGRALAYRDIGRDAEALADFPAALEVVPDYEWSFTRRGWYYEMLGEIDRAKVDYERAVEFSKAERNGEWARSVLAKVDKL